MHKRVALWLLLLSLAGANAKGEAPQRLFQMDDLFEIEHIHLSTVAFSPDGQAVAFARKRAAVKASRADGLVYRYGRDDIWIQDAPGRGLARNLTNGAADDSGWFKPQWSPDGKRLAFLSTRGGGVTLWVWERATDRLSQASVRGVEFQDLDHAFEWADGHRLLCLVKREGEISSPVSLAGIIAKTVTSAWARAASGASTANVVDSLVFHEPEARLLLVDVATGSSREIGAVIGLGATTRSRWWLSPSRDAVVLIRPGSRPHGSAAAVRMGYPETIDLRRLDGVSISLDQSLPNNVITDTLRWSPDGRELAFFAFGDAPINPVLLYGQTAAETMPGHGEPLQNPARLWRVNLANDRVNQLDTGDLDFGYLGGSTFTWTTSGDLVFHLPRYRLGVMRLNDTPRVAYKSGLVHGATGPTARREWWVLGRDGRIRALAKEGPVLPDSLAPVEREVALAGVSQGDVWRIDPVSGAVRNLTATFQPKVTRIASNPGGRHLVLSARTTDHGRESDAGEGSASGRASDAYYVLDTISGRVESLDFHASASARFLAYSPESRSVLYHRADRTGARLWRSSPSISRELLAELNTFVKDVWAASERRVVDYTSLNGQQLQAMLVLPRGYESGRRYPLVVDVYYGQRVGPRWAKQSEWDNWSWPDIVCSAEYAYLVPSMPRNAAGTQPEEQGADSILMLTNGVLPAVDAAIALGVADPRRLFVTGWSTGGWSTMGIVTQTTRFTAAVAGAGYVDLLFGAGGTPLRSRAWPDYSANLHALATPSHGYYPTEVPWWRDGDRFRRNSPLSYVDRVQTPVMMIHGDLDRAVAMAGSEAFFLALSSQRKRAQLVRYFGEDHTIESPANIRDMWQRIFAWFDDFGDISRDGSGNIIFEGDRAKSRKGAPALSPEDFARFGPVGPVESRRASKSPPANAPAVKRTH